LLPSGLAPVPDISSCRLPSTCTMQKDGCMHACSTVHVGDRSTYVLLLDTANVILAPVPDISSCRLPSTCTHAVKHIVLTVPPLCCCLLQPAKQYWLCCCLLQPAKQYWWHQCPTSAADACHQPATCRRMGACMQYSTCW
jgi:hypothetical protein